MLLRGIEDRRGRGKTPAPELTEEQISAMRKRAQQNKRARRRAKLEG